MKHRETARATKSPEYVQKHSAPRPRRHGRWRGENVRPRRRQSDRGGRRNREGDGWGPGPRTRQRQSRTGRGRWQDAQGGRRQGGPTAKLNENKKRAGTPDETRRTRGGEQRELAGENKSGARSGGEAPEDREETPQTTPRGAGDG